MADETNKISVEEKALFAMDETGETVIIGIGEAAYNYIKNGKTHTFDLHQFGLPIKLVIFGGKDHAAMRSMLSIHPNATDVGDVGIKDPPC